MENSLSQEQHGNARQEPPKSEIEEWLRCYSRRFNLPPGTRNPVLVTNRFGLLEGRAMRWGLRMMDAQPGSKIPHVVQAETIPKRRRLRDLIRFRRCLVPSSGYYEWAPGEGKKLPYVIRPADGSMFAFGAIYDAWIDRHGYVHESFCLIETTPAPSIAAIHPKMPVIISEEDRAIWLDRRVTDPGKIQSLLKPFPDERLLAYLVSDMVNDTRNDGPDLSRPREITEPQSKTLSLPRFA